MIKIDCNFDLWKNKIKGSLDFWIKVCYEKDFFCDFVIICMFFCLFLNNKTKIKLSEQE